MAARWAKSWAAARRGAARAGGSAFVTASWASRPFKMNEAIAESDQCRGERRQGDPGYRRASLSYQRLRVRHPMWNPGSPHEPLTAVILAGFPRKGAPDFGASIVAGTMPECAGTSIH